MLPTTSIPQTTDREPVKRDFNDIDSLLRELGTPKEEIRHSPPQPGQSSQQSQLSTDTGDQQPEDKISPEIAALSGKMIAGTIDTVAGTGLMMFAKNSTPEKYQATDRQLVQLENACTAVAMKYNYQVADSPWFNLVILIIAIYLPHWQEAKKDKRFAELQEKLQEETLAREALDKRVENLEQKTKP